MIVLGIDPGLATIGYGVIEKNNDIKVIDYGTIDTPKTERIATRLAMIYEAMVTLIEKFKPDCVAIEELFYFRNQTTIIPVGQARGVIVLACIQRLGNLYEYTPLQIKQALTGHGRAEKKQVQYMVRTILGLNSIPKPDDAADALAVAITHCQTNNTISNNQI